MPFKTLEGRAKAATAKLTSTPKLPLKTFSEAERATLEQWCIFKIQSTGFQVGVWEENVILQLLQICRNERELVYDELPE